MGPEDAERYLLSLEMFGMRFGLDRMRRLMTALGHPEEHFDCVHVVGTNGKSSTTRMTAAILQRHGIRTGTYLSPHLVSFTERIRIDERDIEPQRFAAAVTRARRAVQMVDRSSPEGDEVTQFEALTAAAFSEMAEAGVQAAVVEAGLGGRYDATSVAPSTVQVLTSVGLEHTRWLGPTIRHIATEKLDVVRPGGTLVIGPDLHPDARTIAEEVTAERGARLVVAPEPEELRLGALGTFQRRNFSLARTAAQAFLGQLDSQALSAAAAETLVPGRLQVIAQDPLTVIDGAHNPDGFRALVESLPAIFADRTGLTGVVSILDDKDAAGMLKLLLPQLDRVVFTTSRNPRALPPPTLASLAAQMEGPPSEIVPDARRALECARRLAGANGAVLATGSIYLMADLLTDHPHSQASLL